MFNKYLQSALCGLVCILFTSVSASATEELVNPSTIPSKFSQDKAQFVLNIATPVAEDSVNHYIAYRAKHLFEERSNGRLFANVYEASSLGGERETIEGMLSGTIDFFVTISAAFTPFAPRTGIFDLPNAYPNLDVARKTLDSDFLQLLIPDYEAAGFKMFGFSDAGFRQATSNRLLRKIEDFKGLKIRTMENPNHLAYWKALGANPTPMDFSEVYISLQQGTIDAQENPYDLIVANKLYEPQKYITETNHVIHGLTMMMSKLKYDAMPDDLKQIVEKSVKEALAYGRHVADVRIESRKKIVTDYGCVIELVSPELRKQMLSRLEDVYSQMRKATGDKIMDTFLKRIADIEAVSK
ncbi:MAG: TRAP transporter substrate-binding protein [Candidatus Accumulibacter sp.]|jgi:tripartite ATP-independent transporter DctP family solute receptor|nr:TRAP transporter substrate-binding protein [Accumulibacter sp.]